ncbi:hypothetical protein Hanom_Chr10g00950981 [Helianthus anomalus]
MFIQLVAISYLGHVIAIRTVLKGVKCCSVCNLTCICVVCG